MPCFESETKTKIREIRNSAEPVFDGITTEVKLYEVKKEHFQWLLEQLEKSETENQQMKEGILKVKDAVANDVFAILSHLPK